jgi:hypothetical protein
VGTGSGVLDQHVDPPTGLGERIDQRRGRRALAVSRSSTKRPLSVRCPCLDVSVVDAEVQLRSQSIAAGRTTRSVAADIVARRLTMNLSGLSAVEPNPGEHPAA